LRVPACESVLFGFLTVPPLDPPPSSEWDFLPMKKNSNDLMFQFSMDFVPSFLLVRYLLCSCLDLPRLPKVKELRNFIYPMRISLLDFLLGQLVVERLPRHARPRAFSFRQVTFHPPFFLPQKQALRPEYQSVPPDSLPFFHELVLYRTLPRVSLLFVGVLFQSTSPPRAFFIPLGSANLNSLLPVLASSACPSLSVHL